MSTDWRDPGKAVASVEVTLTGEVQWRHKELIAIVTVLPNRPCGDCAHLAGEHLDVPPGRRPVPGRPDVHGQCRTDGCRCRLSRLEAAGWQGPDGCLGNCR